MKMIAAFYRFLWTDAKKGFSKFFSFSMNDKCKRSDTLNLTSKNVQLLLGV